MEPVTALAGLLGVLLVGSISPGPSFVLVARTAVARSRRDGVSAALVMGVGAVIFTALVLLSLTTVLARVPLLFTGIKLLGGLWLLLLAWRLWQGATAPLALERAVYVLHAFKKKSKRGVETPKHDMDLIRSRLKEAEKQDGATDP